MSFDKARYERWKSTASSDTQQSIEALARLLLKLIADRRSADAVMKEMTRSIPEPKGLASQKGVLVVVVQEARLQSGRAGEMGQTASVLAAIESNCLTDNNAMMAVADIINRRPAMLTMLSNVAKKLSQTSDVITGNMK